MSETPSSYDEAAESGVYFVSGKPKPEGITAFDFPVVANRTSAASVTVWGRAPGPGGVVVQTRRHGAWVAVRRLLLGAHATFQTTVSQPGAGVFRAVLGGETSLAWTVSK